MVISIGSVLEGSIFGDHCSPISDTTVLSSTATASDHIDHVRTQIPYALLVMVVALVAGYLPCCFLGWSPWIGLGLGMAAIVALWALLARSDHGVPEPA
jgi:Na+/H+ antiporter NhaC